MKVKVVSITDVRQDATNLIRHAQEAGEPVLVVKRSKPAAYLVGADRFEALQAELQRLRRTTLVRDVAEAEKEVRHGNLPAYESVDELMASLGPPGVRSSSRRRAGGWRRKSAASKARPKFSVSAPRKKADSKPAGRARSSTSTVSG